MNRELDDYFFDLRGYFALEQAISPEMVAAINAAIDAFPPLEPGEWHGHVQRQAHVAQRGINYQNIVEGGSVFEELIDHASWIDYVRRYVGAIDGLFIDEAFFNIRGPGQAIMKVDYADLMDTSMDGVEASIEIHMRAGDAILFVDSLAHGSARRTRDGERRILVYRYSPRWGNTRFGYRPSDALLKRLTPERRQIIQPIEPRAETLGGSVKTGADPTAG